MKDEQDFAKQTQVQVKWWAIAAGTAPFVALSAIFFLHTVGWDSLVNRAIVIGAMIFFMISTYWWWWAIFKIAKLAEFISGTAEKFSELKRELSWFKHDYNDSTRKWRKPKGPKPRKHKR